MRGAKKQPVLERFERFYIPEPNSGCWLWLGYLNLDGYGSFDADGEVLAHRFSYKFFKGCIPEGFKVLHSCDLPCCVNPDHLRVGTVQDNMTDMVIRKRSCFGEKHAKALLTEEDVREIRNFPKCKGYTTELANKYGVLASTICRIRDRTIWKHVL